jgi:hypothetical protein
MPTTFIDSRAMSCLERLSILGSARKNSTRDVQINAKACKKKLLVLLPKEHMDHCEVLRWTARDAKPKGVAKSYRLVSCPHHPWAIFEVRHPSRQQVSDTNNSNAHTRHHVEADRYRHLRQGRVLQGHHHRPQCLQGQFNDAFRNSRWGADFVVVGRRGAYTYNGGQRAKAHLRTILQCNIARKIAGQSLTPHTGAHPPGYRPRGPHWHEQEPPPAIRRVSLLGQRTLAFSNAATAPRRLVTRLLPSPGVLDVPLLVFPVSLVEEHTVPVRLRSVTCAALVACSLPPRSGASGTRRST